MTYYKLTVSIHAPRAGRDDNLLTDNAEHQVFQSTRPARGATTISVAFIGATRFQSTRPARGATKAAFLSPSSTPCFNPRAPRGARRDSR